MKLDAKTIAVLKNFTQINPSLLFKEGNEVSTISPSKNILATAVLDQSFEKQFAIYDLSRFLQVLSLFDDPELIFNNGFLTIKQGSKKVNYTFADVGTISVPPRSSIHLPSTDVSVNITQAALADVSKAQAVLRLPEIALVGDGNTIALQAVDVKNPDGDVYSVDLGPTDKVFSAVFKSENLKVIAGDYEVEIASAGITQWTGNGVTYWIALETSSKF